MGSASRRSWASTGSRKSSATSLERPSRGSSAGRWNSGGRSAKRPTARPKSLLRERLTAADGFIDPGRRYGDLVVSAFFAADNDRKRKERLESLAEDLAAQRSQFDVTRHQRLDAAVGGLRGGLHPVVPFHWEIEFPEVFDRANGGFDAFVGNPPFMGGKRISSMLGDGYRDWLPTIHEETISNSDLVAHFFRRAFPYFEQAGRWALSPPTQSRRVTHGSLGYAGSAPKQDKSTMRSNESSGLDKRPSLSVWFTS